ncbi:MAG: hypothetical protein GY940_04565, partial [bacterium]|nr:hypothetical protein [bacterium]
QVKIRGFRVEPGEIESKLLAVNGVKDCVVVVKNDNSGQKILLAYTVTDSHQLTGNKIKIQIAEKLPQYMIPAIIPVERLPLMPNGKVDRDRLPGPEIQPEITYTAPRNEIEKFLVEMWSGLLELDKEKIGIDANFFDSGGHSLKAMMLTSAVRKKYPIQFPLHQVFSHPTIREISQYIRNAEYGFHPFQYREIPVAPEADYYPQSAAQRRLFFLDQLQETGIAYNLTAAFLVKGKPDRQRFQSTLQALVNRHEGLRTSFKAIAGEPVQIVHRKDSIDFKLEPIQTLARPAGENKRDPAMIKETVEIFR